MSASLRMSEEQCSVWSKEVMTVFVLMLVQVDPKRYVRVSQSPTLSCERHDKLKEGGTLTWATNSKLASSRIRKKTGTNVCRRYLPHSQIRTARNRRHLLLVNLKFCSSHTEYLRNKSQSWKKRCISDYGLFVFVFELQAQGQSSFNVIINSDLLQRSQISTGQVYKSHQPLNSMMMDTY